MNQKFLIKKGAALALRLAAGLGLMIALVSLMALSAAPVAAEIPPGNNQGHQLYLPLVIKSDGNAAPTGPYTEMLKKVQQNCATTGFNQLCVANGQVAVQPEAGATTTNQAGSISDLAGVQSLSLTSAGTDPRQWSIAWLRLRADSDLPDQALNILAVGNVQITNIALLGSQTGVTDTVVLPSLQFESNPIPGVAKEGSSGLIVINPSPEELLSLTLNSAEVTLGSTALAQAQPGQLLTVTMATGTSLTQAGGDGSSAIKNQQVSVPLNQAGQAAGSPAPTTAIDPLKYVFSDAFTDEPDHELGASVLRKLNRSIDRCLNNEPRYVYNVLFWTHIIETKPALKAQIAPDKLAEAYNRAPNCLTFEVHFWSYVITKSAYHSQDSTISDKPETIKVQFYPAGGFMMSGTNDTLDYEAYHYTPLVAACPISTETTPGRLMVSDGTLKIAVNKVRVSLDLQVRDQPADRALLNCPSVPPLVLAQNHWVTVFYHLHEGFRPGSDLHSFRFDWDMAAKYGFSLGRYNTQKAEAEFAFEGETNVGLIHFPNGMN